MGRKDRKGADEPASDLFMQIFTDAGSIVTDCDFCGRTHFATNEERQDYDEGELERLRKQAEDNPDDYIEQGDVDMISHGYLNGQRFVWGCPCNWPRRYELFIWAHREDIAQYLMRRAKEERDDANRTVRAIGGILKSMEDPPEGTHVRQG